MNYLKNYFADWSAFEKIWLASFTMIGVALFFMWQDTYLGLFSLLTGMWCVVLVAKAKRFNYVPGLINVITYAYISYVGKLYGEVMLNALYFLPMQFIGFWYWSKYVVSNDTVSVKMLSNKLRLALVVGSAGSIVGYGFVLQLLRGNFPFIDSTSTVLSVIACVLMTLRYGEQWALWIFVNIASIAMWVGTLMAGGEAAAFAPSMIIMWSAYLVNAVYGLYNWNKMSKLQTV